jgi:hypothetical protein
METEYDVFEILLNRTVKWHLCVREKQRALDMLKALGSRTFNECFAPDLRTREIIGRVNNEGPSPAEFVVSEGNGLSQ